MQANETCKQQPGVMIPVINRNKCEGKADCVTVCPMAVFAVQTLPEEQRKNLNLIGKLKGRVHKWQQAFLVLPDACEGCGLCVRSCPESAITLTRR